MRRLILCAAALAGCTGFGEADERAAPRPRHRQGLGVDRGEDVGAGEEVRQTGYAGLDRHPVRRHDPAGDGARAGDGDLLADDRADRGR